MLNINGECLVTGHLCAEKITGDIHYPCGEPVACSFTRTKDMNFGQAIEKLKSGKKVAREGWNGKGQYVVLLNPYAVHPEDAEADDISKLETNPYFRMADNNPYAEGTFTPFFILKIAQNKVFPWLPSTGDLLADDWQIIE
jgi:hypothetical protein